MGSIVEGEREPGIADPTCVPDTFVEGIGKIEIIAGNLRTTWYATRDIGDGVERMVVARLVVPLSRVPNGMRQMAAAVAGLPFMSDSKAPDIVPN